MMGTVGSSLQTSYSENTSQVVHITLTQGPLKYVIQIVVHRKTPF